MYCADAVNRVCFSLAGDGKLIDNQGTSSGSEFVQLYSGSAIIHVDTKKGRSVAAVKSDGMETVTLSLK